MDKNKGKRQIKKIQKEIHSLRNRLKKTELRPCKGDSEILQKEKDIKGLKKQIHSLEVECDRYTFTWWQNEKVVYHGNIRTEKFHKPTCKYFDWKNCTEIFHTRTDAIESGYVPCKICNP
jgi:hypothetical protein